MALNFFFLFIVTGTTTTVVAPVQRLILTMPSLQLVKKNAFSIKYFFSFAPTPFLRLFRINCVTHNFATAFDFVVVVVEISIRAPTTKSKHRDAGRECER